jgi:glycosyltransferase involved in cell wall biosynthesis
MSTTSLLVVLDDAGGAVPSRLGQFTRELVRSLIETTPRGCDVRGFVPSSPAEEYARIDEALPGLSSLEKSALDRQQLMAAWQHGFTRIHRGGMIHAPSLLAPLYRHDRLNSPGEQIVVTIHDASCWTHPELLPSRQVARERAMGRRAERYADAVIVPTHAVAEQLSGFLELGNRIRVIPGAASSDLERPDDADDRRARLGLPDRFMLSVEPLTAASGVGDLVTAVADGALPDDVPLIIVGEGPLDLDSAIADAGVSSDRLRVIPLLDRRDLATLYHDAALLVAPTVVDGFGQSALEAMRAGTPVVHTDAEGLAETCLDAGVIVERSEPSTFGHRLAETMARVLDDDKLASELRERGRDRARAFSWRDTGERVWQVHADL